MFSKRPHLGGILQSVCTLGVGRGMFTRVHTALCTAKQHVMSNRVTAMYPFH
jgi:hypothetical protein